MTVGKVTPMMQQFNSIKEQYPDYIVFFRLGDFYEMFGDDAVKASEILNITLTSRNKNDENALPMCGIPYHSAESYIAKLNQHGEKVVMCEQVGETKGPGLVQRQVTRVITPSTNLSEYNLNEAENQFLASIVFEKKTNQYGLCIADISTSQLFTGTYELTDLISLISTYNVVEIIATPDLAEDPTFYNKLQTNLKNCLISKRKLTASINSIQDFLTKKFNLTTLNSLGLEIQNPNTSAVYLLLEYIEFELKLNFSNLETITQLTDKNFFDLDKTSLVNLEIFYTNQDFSKTNSLFNHINQTVTSAGSRLLRQWIIRPLKNIDLIQHRLDHVSEFLSVHATTGLELRNSLKNYADLERLVSKISLGFGKENDLIAILQTLEVIAHLQKVLSGDLPLTNKLLNNLQDTSQLQELLTEALEQDGDGNAQIKSSYDSEIAEYRNLLNTGKQFLLDLQINESNKTGISNLKISFNKVFGYYIEVSKGRLDKVPDYFIRKQTLTNSERFITPELKEYEDKILTAEQKLKERESIIFAKLYAECVKNKAELLNNAQIIAELDVLCSFAFLSLSKNLSKPTLSTEQILEIKAGRHLVIEQLIGEENFIPNDTTFNEQTRIKLLTGPNMGGKSTYLRQNAIIVLLAQIGCFVPCSSAVIGVVDQIYTRVGASDNISKGLSTFMVEMEETAYILKHATNDSLLILDEIGRGTSTFDGVSLAWSILEHIHNHIKAITLFATHYHELIEVTNSLPNAENISVAVEDDGTFEPVFLHKINTGAIHKSYGVHVATMAGIPKSVLTRASQILTDLEDGTTQSNSFVDTQSNPLSSSPDNNIKQESLFVPEPLIDPNLERIQRSLKEVDINQLTPLDALQLLNDLKDISES